MVMLGFVQDLSYTCNQELLQMNLCAKARPVLKCHSRC